MTIPKPQSSLTTGYPPLLLDIIIIIWPDSPKSEPDFMFLFCCVIPHSLAIGHTAQHFLMCPSDENRESLLFGCCAHRGFGSCRMLLSSLMKYCFISRRTPAIRTANLTRVPDATFEAQVQVFSLLFDLLLAHVRFCGTGKLNDRDGLGSEVEKDDVRLSRREVSGRGESKFGIPHLPRQTRSPLTPLAGRALSPNITFICIIISYNKYSTSLLSLKSILLKIQLEKGYSRVPIGTYGNYEAVKPTCVKKWLKDKIHKKIIVAQ
jgi:hypothetical protein